MARAEMHIQHHNFEEEVRQRRRQDIISSAQEKIYTELDETQQDWFICFKSILNSAGIRAFTSLQASDYERISAEIIDLSEEAVRLRGEYIAAGNFEEGEDPAAREGTQAEIGRSPSIVECLSMTVSDIERKLDEKKLKAERRDQNYLLEKYADLILEIEDIKTSDLQNRFDPENKLSAL